MTMAMIGKREKVELRKVWEDEAKDFTPWVGSEEGLALLGDAIEMDLEPDETESRVGPFSADVVARDQASGRTVVIENQLEQTNHDHLGKLVTYAAGKDASVAIWVVKTAGEQHAKAIEWLNEHTDESVGFFLVEVDLDRIDASLPAPVFRVIEKPNGWSRTFKEAEALSEAQRLRLEYWQTYYERARDDDSFTLHPQRPSRGNSSSSDLAVGRSGVLIRLGISKKAGKSAKLSARIVVKKDMELFERLRPHIDWLEKSVGSKPIIGEKKERTITVSKPDSPLSERARWPEYISWHLDTAIKLKRFLDEHGGLVS